MINIGYLIEDIESQILQIQMKREVQGEQPKSQKNVKLQFVIQNVDNTQNDNSQNINENQRNRINSQKKAKETKVDSKNYKGDIKHEYGKSKVNTQIGTISEDEFLMGGIEIEKGSCGNQEKVWISQLQTQLRVENKKKNDLLQSNNSLNTLLRAQDEKLQTYMEEIRDLRRQKDSLLKDNSLLHSRIEGFASEKNTLVVDNRLLKEELKKLQVKLSLPQQNSVPKQQINLKTITHFSRDNQYIDSTLLQNDLTLQQLGYASVSAIPIPNLSQLLLADNSNIQSLSSNYNSKKTMSNPFGDSQNLRITQSISPNNCFKTNANNDYNYPQRSNSNNWDSLRGSRQDDYNLSENILSGTDLAIKKGSSLKEGMLRNDSMEERIYELESQKKTQQYEINLLNEALLKEEQGEQTQRLIQQLVESKSLIYQQQQNQIFLEERIKQFERLVNEYTHQKPLEMDRASLERKNKFLISENQSLKKEMNSLNKYQQESKKSISITDIQKEIVNNRSDMSSENRGSNSPQDIVSSHTRISLGNSIENQRRDKKNGDKLKIICCKEQKNKRIGIQNNLENQENTDKRPNIDRLLAAEKQKNILLTRLIEEEQEKNCEYRVYKDEVTRFQDKNRNLQKEVNLLNKQLNELNFSKIPSQLDPYNIHLNQRNISPSYLIKGQSNKRNISPQQKTHKRSLSPDRRGDSPKQSPRSIYSPQNVQKDRAFSAEESEIVIAHKQIEKELNLEIEKKEQQIENILNSRNLMQRTLGDQLKNFKRTNKELKEENIHLQNQIDILNQEIQPLKTLVRRAEKKNLL